MESQTERCIVSIVCLSFYSNSFPLLLHGLLLLEIEFRVDGEASCLFALLLIRHPIPLPMVEKKEEEKCVRIVMKNAMGYVDSFFPVKCKESA